MAPPGPELPARGSGRPTIPRTGALMVSRETRIGEVFVQLADTMVGDFDVAELMLQLADACL